MQKTSALQLWLTLFFLGVVMRPFISTVYPIIDELRNSLHTNPLIAALLVSIPVFCIGIFSLISKNMAEFVQKEWLLFLSLCLLGVAFLLRAATENTIIILFFTCLGGVGIGIAGALAGNFAQQFFPHKILLSMGIYTVGIALGATIGSFTAALHTAPFGSVWQFSQIEWAILIFIFAAIWFLLFCKKRPFKKVPDHLEKLDLPFKNNIAWQITILFTIQSLIFYGLMTWIVPYYQNLQLPFSKDIPAILLAIQLIASWVVPHTLEFFKKSMMPLLVLSAILTVSLLFLYFSPITFLWPTLIGLGIATGATFPLCLSNPMLFFKNETESNHAFSMMFGLGYFFSGLGPLLLASFINIEKTYAGAFLLLAFFSLAMIVTTLVLQKKLPR